MPIHFSGDRTCIWRKFPTFAGEFLYIIIYTTSDMEKKTTEEEALAYLWHGEMLAAEGRLKEAEADFRRVLELNPLHTKALGYMGDLFAYQKKWEEAIQFFSEMIGQTPLSAKAYSERGRAKHLKGDEKGAFEDLKRAIELNPTGEEAQRLEGIHRNFARK